VFYGHTPWQIAASVIVPAGIVALIYAICALSTKRDDLGAWPPISDPAPTAVVDRPVDPSSPSP
jgi:hypothetical protein